MFFLFNTFLIYLVTPPRYSRFFLLLPFHVIYLYTACINPLFLYPFSVYILSLCSFLLVKSFSYVISFLCSSSFYINSFSVNYVLFFHFRLSRLCDFAFYISFSRMFFHHSYLFFIFPFFVLFFLVYPLFVCFFSVYLFYMSLLRISLHYMSLLHISLLRISLFNMSLLHISFLHMSLLHMSLFYIFSLYMSHGSPCLMSPYVTFLFCIFYV